MAFKRASSVSDVTLAGPGDQQGRGGIDRHAGHREQEKLHPTLRYGYARILLLNHKHRVAGSSPRVAYFVFRYLLTGRSKGGEGRDPGRFFSPRFRDRLGADFFPTFRA